MIYGSGNVTFLYELYLLAENRTSIVITIYELGYIFGLVYKTPFQYPIFGGEKIIRLFI